MSSNRVYRSNASGIRLTSFPVTVKESDLWIAVSSSAFHESLPLQVENVVLKIRQQIESYLNAHEGMASFLEPYLITDQAPEIIHAMVWAGNRVGVGPMAAVAGAVAEAVGRYLLALSPEVIVENGGDIFLKVDRPIMVGVYAGNSPLSGKLALKIYAEQTPLGICTSSGTVGPSYSEGRADAAIALAESTPLADAAATALGNIVKSASDLEAALEFAGKIEGIKGALLICEDKIAAWGELELINT